LELAPALYNFGEVPSAPISFGEEPATSAHVFLQLELHAAFA
jgi:hypothetical protein